MVSADDWNTRQVSDVIVAPVVDGHTHDAGRYAPLIDAGGHAMTVYVDELFGVPRTGLGKPVLRLDDLAMASVDEALGRAISQDRASRSVPRPSGHPYAGQMRFADLHIEHEGEKPIVVVSSEAFSAESGYTLVLVCRVTSRSQPVHDLDVPLRQGKVVCSDLRTVAAEDIRERAPQQSALTPSERRAVQVAVRRLLALPN